MEGDVAAGWIVEVELTGETGRRSKPTFIANCEAAPDAREAVLGYLGLAAEEEVADARPGHGTLARDARSGRSRIVSMAPVRPVSAAVLDFVSLEGGKVARWA